MSDTDRDRDPFAAGAAEAARLARQVQDLGFETAKTVVERFVELCTQFTRANGGTGAGRRDTGTGPPFWYWDWGSEGSLQKMQSDMLRATEAYLAVLRQLNEAGLRFFDTTRAPEPSKAKREDVVLPQVAPGGRVSAKLWLHNTTTAAAVGLRPWCSGLSSHSGATIGAEAVTCRPDRIDRLDPGASRELVVTVEVAKDATAGTYHGQLLVDGQPDLVFGVRVPVLPTTDR